MKIVENLLKITIFSLIIFSFFYFVLYYNVYPTQSDPKNTIIISKNELNVVKNLDEYDNPSNQYIDILDSDVNVEDNNILQKNVDSEKIVTAKSQVTDENIITIELDKKTNNKLSDYEIIDDDSEITDDINYKIICGDINFGVKSIGELTSKPKDDLAIVTLLSKSTSVRDTNVIAMVNKNENEGKYIASSYWVFCAVIEKGGNLKRISNVSSNHYFIPGNHKTLKKAVIKYQKKFNIYATQLYNKDKNDKKFIMDPVFSSKVPCYLVVHRIAYGKKDNMMNVNSESSRTWILVDLDGNPCKDSGYEEFDTHIKFEDIFN